jgi:tight adherence protein B
VSGAALHLAWLALIAAMGGALYGLWLTAASFGGASRRVTRRLARARPQAGLEPETEEEPGGRALFTWTDRHLPRLQKRLASANAPFSPSQIVLLQIALGATVLLALDLAHVPSIAGLPLAALVGFGVPLLAVGVLAERRRKRFVTQLPQAIDLIARSLQAGHPITAAMAVAAEQMSEPLGPELKVVIAEMNFGLDRDTALRHLADRFPVPELRMFAASLEITRETGGNIAEVLLGLADRLRQHAQLRKKVDALSAEGRLSFWVIAALPVLAGGAILAIRPQYYGEVMGDPLFWPMMAEPPIMLTIGAVVIWRMINFRF